MYDVIIIGGGPAGIAAAIYLARKKINFLLLTEDYGGQMAKSSSVENYPGFGKISGLELTDKFQKHLAEYAVANKVEEVKEVKKLAAGFEVITRSQNFQTKTLIICSGKNHRHLNVPGEEEFSGKGVSYCATCDAPLFQDKKVVVVGGGNSALDAAIEIEKHALKVTIINLGAEIQGDAILLERFEKSPKAKIINQAKTTAIYGEGLVRGIKYEDQTTHEIKDLPCEGVFVEIGWLPSTNFIKDLVKLNKLGEVEVDKNGATSTAGIFAAGDVTDSSAKQIVIAVGMGATAALSAWKYVISHPQVRPAD